MANVKANKKSSDSYLAYVTPAVVAWALDRSTISRAQVAKQLNVNADTLDEWSRPTGVHPPFSKAEALARLLHVPFGFFYLTTPPDTALPLPDFRGFDRTYRPSDELLEIINDCLLKRDWYAEREVASGAKPLPFVGRFSVTDDVTDVARAIASHIGVSTELRQASTTWSDFLSSFCRRAENAGVLVMRSSVVGNVTTRSLPRNELLGFAIADRYAPIVFINSADYRASQVFTLAHELAHIWIGESALDNPDELAEKNHGKIEDFCNKVAAELLVPAAEFSSAWKTLSGPPDQKIQKLARRFWVSSYVTLRRASELSKISEFDYHRIRKAESNRRKKDKGGGGNYYRNVAVRMSHRFVDAVLTDVNRGTLELKDAAQLLSMKVPTLVKFAEKWK